MTSTPSRIACSTAATESELKQPCSSADAVHDHVGAGGDAADRAAVDAEERRESTGSPAAVVEVCVPWPSASRAEQMCVALLQNSPGAAPITAM